MLTLYILILGYILTSNVNSQHAIYNPLASLIASPDSAVKNTLGTEKLQRSARYSLYQKFLMRHATLASFKLNTNERSFMDIHTILDG